jgi:hypothetical protein
MEFSDIDIQHYVEKKKNGTDYSLIRKELETKGINKEDISELIRQVDSIILEENTKIPSIGKAKETKLLGYVLMFGGGFVTLATYFEWIDISGIYIVAWGPILGGYFLILSARIANKKRNIRGFKKK